jgi:hypothetical protein
VIGIISKEVFRLHKLLGYIDDDRDRKFPGAVWQKPNRSIGT